MIEVINGGRTPIGAASRSEVSAAEPVKVRLLMVDGNQFV
jgi:hypothetical protein